MHEETEQALHMQRGMGPSRQRPRQRRSSGVEAEIFAASTVMWEEAVRCGASGHCLATKRAATACLNDCDGTHAKRNRKARAGLPTSAETAQCMRHVSRVEGRVKIVGECVRISKLGHTCMT